MNYISSFAALTCITFIFMTVFIITFKGTKRRCISEENQFITSNGAKEISNSIQSSAVLKNCGRSILCEAIKEQASLPLQEMNVETLKFVFYGMVTSVEYDCTTSKWFGQRTKNDGNYHVCMNSTATPVPKNCLVYSFGISNDWSFDEDFARYGCEVHSFDPSIGKDDHIHPPNIQFHNLGLFGDDFVDKRGWKLRKLSTIRKMLSHEERKLDILKIDVESAEWPALRNLILEDTEELKSVKQLIMEIHSPLLRGHTLKKRHLFEIIYYLKELRKLGFLVFKSFQRNGCCLRFSPLMPRGIPEKCCHEASFINTRYL